MILLPNVLKRLKPTRTDHADNNFRLLYSCSPYRDSPCYRPCLAAEIPAEVEHFAANTLLANHLAPRQTGVVADPDSSAGNLGMGNVLHLAGLPARRRISVLFFRGHLHDDRLWRPRATHALESARTG